MKEAHKINVKLNELNQAYAQNQWKKTQIDTNNNGFTNFISNRMNFLRCYVSQLHCCDSRTTIVQHLF